MGMYFCFILFGLMALSAQAQQQQPYFTGPETYNPYYVHEFNKRKVEFDRLKQKADSGNADAQLELSKLYMEGMNGLPRDMKKSVEYLEKSAQNGNAEALFALSSLYNGGMFGITKNLTKAGEYLKQAGEGGSKDAAATLAAAYFTGDMYPNIKKDEVEGLAYLMLAAETGDEDHIKSLEQAKVHFPAGQVSRAEKRFEVLKKGPYYDR